MPPSVRKTCSYAAVLGRDFAPIALFETTAFSIPFEDKLTVEQPNIERVRFERDNRLDGCVERGMYGVPAKIGADIDIKGPVSPF